MSSVCVHKHLPFSTSHSLYLSTGVISGCPPSKVHIPATISSVGEEEEEEEEVGGGGEGRRGVE